MELAIAGNNHRPSPATPTAKMDRKIWSKLPVELLERILSSLPIKTFFSLRSTCKYFRSVIFSPQFISKNTDSPISSFLLLSHPQSTNYLLYDTDLNIWREFGLPLSRSPLLSTASCLLCFPALPDSSNSAFIIHNLISRSSRTVMFPEYPFPFELPTLITNKNGYKLFCSSKNHVYVYDASASNWTRHNGIQRTLGDSYYQQGVVHNGSLYFSTREPFAVMNFDLNTGNWSTLDVRLPDELTFVRLASGDVEKTHTNRLFMFGGIGRNGISKNMKIWELDEIERKWDEIESMPEMMCRKFGSICYHNYEHIYCFWHQGMICVCCYTWPEVLYYKVSRKTWHWLPKCPYLPPKSSCGFKWFSFVPDIYAFV